MDLDDNETVLAATGFFQDLDESQRRLLAFSSERMTHEAGTVLYRARGMAEGAHVLIKGELEIKAQGEDDPERVSEPGTVLAAMALIVARPRPVTVTVAEPAETLFVPRTAFLKLIRSYPDLAERLAQRISGQLSDYVRAFGPVRSRMGQTSDKK